ncbi:chemotaxis protein CheX [Butyrivibrio sp. DSM 10294]|uniref:chemotaxis protein CheX n=1 Tax=Butyrivibrio sp. DSM 10294 TaxID=2972457 RepID=UPI00234F0C8B|nr:chemotaxis protein CheX [Butyrivibrio sp. DSM 10294]MDC7293624.1 chemotaxis protein CheX [Butyrivibrio sp. DSM 10294]
MFDRIIGRYLLEQNLINKLQLSQVYQLQEANRAKLGVIAVSEKLMTIAQAEQVNALQATMDKRFGDIAIEKGYLTETQVGRLLELQGNGYLAFVQALVDTNYLPLEQIYEAEMNFQKANGFTESDMAALKTGDVAKIVPIFVNTENPLYRQMFAMGIKNMYRLVDSHVYVGKAYKVRSFKEEVMGFQKLHGDQKATVAITGKYEDVQRMAVAYTKEEFIETREDALDAVCELINCINGLYATEQSWNDSKIELEPPEFKVSFSEASCDEIWVMPVYICQGEVKYMIAISENMRIS